jgi:hypothetical protein
MKLVGLEEVGGGGTGPAQDFDNGYSKLQKIQNTKSFINCYSLPFI